MNDHERSADESAATAEEPVQLPRAARRMAAKELAAARGKKAKITRKRAAALASALGLTSRSIYRAAKRGHVGRRKAGVRPLTEEEQREFIRCGGSAAALARRMKKRSRNAASESTYRRRVKATFNAAELAFIRGGAKAMRGKQLYAPSSVAQRNDVWQIDFTVPPIEVVAKEGSSAVRRMVECAILDHKTRKVLAWVAEMRVAPTSAMALAALAQALWRYGTPSLLVTDNGAEFLSQGFIRVGAVFGFDIQPARPYSPHQKGIVERFFYTKEQDFLRGLPFYTNGPRDLANQLYGPENGRLTASAYVEQGSAWIDAYNRGHQHSSLGGQTPDEAWDADATALRLVDEHDLWWLLPADPRRRMVYGFGVLFNKERYFALPLLDHVDNRLEVRAIPGETGQVWLVDGDELACIAKRWDDQPPAVVRAVIQRRDTEQEAMQQLLTETENGKPPTDGAETAPLDEALLRELVKAVEEDLDAARLRDLADDPPRPQAPGRARHANLNRPLQPRSITANPGSDS